MPRVESHLLAFETRNTLRSEGKKRSITTGGRGAGTHPPGPGKRRGCDSRLWWTGATSLLEITLEIIDPSASVLTVSYYKSIHVAEWVFYISTVFSASL